MRVVTARDLELYAINTGEFHDLHKSLAADPKAGLGVWLGHVRTTVWRRYCREIEPVSITATTVATVAANLKSYYETHIKELNQ
jgi:hypothetical protein